MFVIIFGLVRERDTNTQTNKAIQCNIKKPTDAYITVIRYSLFQALIQIQIVDGNLKTPTLILLRNFLSAYFSLFRKLVDNVN